MISMRVSVTSDRLVPCESDLVRNGLDDFSFGQCHGVLQYVWGAMQEGEQNDRARWQSICQ